MHRRSVWYFWQATLEVLRAQTDSTSGFDTAHMLRVQALRISSLGYEYGTTAQAAAIAVQHKTRLNTFIFAGKLYQVALFLL